MKTKITIEIEMPIECWDAHDACVKQERIDLGRLFAGRLALCTEAVSEQEVVRRHAFLRDKEGPITMRIKLVGA